MTIEKSKADAKQFIRAVAGLYGHLGALERARYMYSQFKRKPVWLALAITELEQICEGA